MEYGMRGSRFLLFATRAAARGCRFAFTKVSMPAAPAGKSFFPFYISNEFQNFFTVIK